MTFFSALEAAPVAASAALRALPGHVPLLVTLVAGHLAPAAAALRALPGHVTLLPALEAALVAATGGAVSRNVAFLVALVASHLAGSATGGAVTGHVAFLVALEARHLGLGGAVALAVALLKTQSLFQSQSLIKS